MKNEDNQESSIATVKFKLCQGYETGGGFGQWL